MRKITSLLVVAASLGLIQVAFPNASNGLIGLFTGSAEMPASNVAPLLPKNADRDKPGFPHVNYDDPAAAVREDGNSATASATTLATTADFDSDGVPDLVTTGVGGRVLFYKGSPDTIYPNSPEAKQRRAADGEAAPFSAAVPVAELGFAPDFLESGDFNADGFSDLLTAANGSSQLTVLHGNGRGSFAAQQAVRIDGSITAFAVGEIGRKDQQSDVAVAYQNREGSFVAIFEHPEGAFARKAEIFAQPIALRSIAIGNLDRDPYGDVVAAGGSKLTLIHGRAQAYPLDMKADLDIQRPAAFVQTRQMPFAIADVAIGRFGVQRGENIALLSTDGRITLLEPQRNEVVVNTNKLTIEEIQHAVAPSMRPVDAELRNFGVIKNDPPKTQDEAEERGQIVTDRITNNENREKIFNDKFAAVQQDFAERPVSERNAIISARVQKTVETTARRKAAYEAALAPKPVPFSKFKVETIAADAAIANAISSGRQHHLIKGRFSDSGLDDIALLDPVAGRVNVVGRWSVDGQPNRQASVVSLGVAQGVVSVVPMRLNADALSDLVVIGPGSPSVMMSLPVVTYTVNSTDDTSSSDCVTPNSVCTLRRAIYLASIEWSGTLITFDIPGTGVHTIHPTSNFPDIGAQTTIDGTTQPGFAGFPLIEISGDLMTGGHEGLKIKASNSLVRGLAINQIPSVFDNNNSQVGGSGITILSTSVFQNVGNVIIEGNFIGTDTTGEIKKGNDANGVHIFDADGNTVGGTAVWAGNILSGNGNPTENKQGVGLAITGGNNNFIHGNYIGTNAPGNLKLGNSYGVFFTGINNQFGGDAFGEGNLVSGNGGPPTQFNQCRGEGLVISALIDLGTWSIATDANNVKGNKIGTTANGIGPLGNCGLGLYSPADVNSVIGSITQTGRNTIADNGHDALWCGYNSDTSYGLSGACTIIGNNIGTDITGTTTLKNDQRNNTCVGFCLQTDTVNISPSDIAFAIVGSPGGTSPGGSCTGMCNLISGNYSNTLGGGGLWQAGVGFVFAVNNYIGVNRAGTAALPNFSGFFSTGGPFVFGAELSDGQGGTIDGGNVVSGNNGNGISTTANVGGGTFEIRGNLIGLSSDGNSPLGNGIGGSGSCGICARSFAGTSTVIGGTGSLQRNYIADEKDASNFASRGVGISINTFGGATTTVFNNWVGLNRSGNLAGNSGVGVEVRGDGQTRIGGLGPNEANLIFGNGLAGVSVSQFNTSPNNLLAKNVTIRRNGIGINGGLGIDLMEASLGNPYQPGVTANDCFDEDDGPNEYQNYPVLFPPVVNGNGTVSVPTTLRSVPSRQFVIDYYQSPSADPTNYGEGSNYLGSVTVQTDGNGFVGFTFTSPNPILPTQLSFTATATDEFGNTSEFSCAAGVCETGSFQEAIERPEDLTCVQPIVVNIETDDNDPNTADGFCDVDLGTPGLQCSLRAAIQEANARNGLDVINFDIAGGGVRTIMPMTALPSITERVIVNGTSQPGYAGLPLIEVKDGNNAGTGIAIQTSKVTISGLAIHRFLTADISIVGSDNVVEGCILGVLPDGNTADNTRQATAAIAISGSASQRNRIGGAVPANGNVIGNSQTGIFIQSPAKTTTVINNKIGTNLFGNAALPNGVGIAIAGSTGNTIGGILDEDTNLISGNTSAGISITAGASTNRIEGNLIGTDLSGDAPLGNGTAGLVIGSSAANNTVGGAPDRRNIISGNAPSDGIVITNGAGQNTISGNYVGLNKAGNLAVPNKWGVTILDTTNSVGSPTGPPNIISGNDQGVVIGAIGSSVSGVSVVNNFIGTDFSGNTVIPNQIGVVLLENVSSSSISENVISGNTREGILTGGVNVGPSNITISGNKVGTNQAGTLALPNGFGVFLFSGTNNSTVTENLISGNGIIGLQMGGGGVGSRTPKELARLLGRNDLTLTLPIENNTVTGNFIGTTISGAFGLGNGKSGIFLGADAFNNQIGGQRSAGEGNVVSGNDQAPGIGISVGVFNAPFDLVDHPTGNKIQGNRIGIKSSSYAALPNEIGVKVKLGNNNILGGDAANCTPQNNCDINDYGNIIGGNNQQGIWLEGSFATDNFIASNYIGVAPDGTAIGNGSHGVHLALGANNNTIGEGNTIGSNGGSGIFIEDGVTARMEGAQSSQMNRVVGNKIFNNAGLGIDIFPAGTNPNDPGDADNGPNRGQNYPVINNFSIDGGGDLIVLYRLDTDTANANYGANGIYVQFFKSDASGQGQAFLNTDYWNVNDQSSGTSKTVNLGNAAALGVTLSDLMTATATDADGNTSEFVPVGAIPSPTPTASPSPTPNKCLFSNGGFESGNLPPWVVQDNIPPPFVSNVQAHGGTFSAFIGAPSGSGDVQGDSSIFQVVTVPAGGGMLSFRYRPETTDTIDFVWQDVYVTDQAGTTVLATILHVADNSQTWTQVNYDMAAFAGTTVAVKFLVHGDGNGFWTNMYVDDVCLSSTSTSTPTATPTSTPPASIGGTITYGNAIGNPALRFVSNVLLSAAGSIPVSALTNTSGNYSLTGFGSGGYTITPSKTGGQNSAISSFDAALIAQHVLGAPLPQLTGNQLLVADVSGNSTISSFDAAQTARYVVGLVPFGATGNWKFDPLSKNYPSITSSITGEDYSALLMGEVSGDWNNSGTRTVVSGRLSVLSNISVDMPEMAASENTEIVIPVAVKGIAGKGIIGYEFDLNYDPSVIRPQVDAIDLAGTASRDLTAVFNAETRGLLRVAVYGPMPVSSDGVLLNLKFSAVGRRGAASKLIWQRIMFNEGIQRAASDGVVEIKGKF